ncbi:MAG: glycosyltransferase family 1 protein, partial [Ginsengibacter sp.]
MDLICFCHIRWNFVYQRPQHLLNRFAKNSRVFVVEEPIYDSDSDYYEINQPDEQVNLWVVVFHVSNNTLEDRMNLTLKALVDSFMFSNKIKQYILWFYSPMALQYAEHLSPSLTIYDCMDELSAFKNPPAGIKEMEARLLNLSDLVFTGGHSLYKAKKHLHENIYSFPSSIDKSHFESARVFKKDPDDQVLIPHPRFGFYGVIDERFD